MDKLFPSPTNDFMKPDACTCKCQTMVQTHTSSSPDSLPPTFSPFMSPEKISYDVSPLNTMEGDTQVCTCNKTHTAQQIFATFLMMSSSGNY